MSKRTSKNSIIVFALVLAGILAIQGYWVVSIIQIREKQFNDNVTQALKATVASNDQQENVFILNKTFDDDKKQKTDTEKEKQIKLITRSSVTKKGNATISTSYSYSINDNDTEIVNVANAKTESAIANAFVFNSIDGDSVVSKIIEDSSSVDDKLSKIKIMINKISLSDRDSTQLLPNGKELTENFAKQLGTNDLDLPFELGIFLNGKNYFLTQNADSARIFSSELSADLFPDDILKRKATLYVYFPSKFGHLFKEIIWVLLAVMLFSIVLIYLFVKTLSNYNKQKKLNELKSDFINNLTHELKTPLATIQLAAEVIIKHSSENGSQSAQMAETIKKQSQKMDADVRNMLQIALLEHADEHVLQKESFNLCDLLITCRDHFQLSAENKNIVLELECPETLILKADRSLMEKAVCNLIDNAIKYSPENGKIIIQAEKDSEYATIRLHDNGSGISEADLPYIFTKFYKAGKGNVHNNKGYGLGLSFVKKIAELHGGKAGATSKPGIETIVSISIPLN